jgi:hypothetical protein
MVYKLLMSFVYTAMNCYSRLGRKSSLPRVGPTSPFGSLPKLSERDELKRCIHESKLALDERWAFLVLGRHQAGQTIDAIGDIRSDPSAARRMNAWVDTRMSNILGPSSDDARDALYPVPAARLRQATESLRRMRLPSLYGAKQGVARSKRSGLGPVKEQRIEDLRRIEAELFQLYEKREEAVAVLVEVVKSGTGLIEQYVRSD